MATHTPTDEAQPEAETIRHYLGSVNAAYLMACAQLARLFGFGLLISAVLLALTFGVVSADESLEISGIKFSIQLSTLLGLTAVVSGALYVTLWSMVWRAGELGLEMERLYVSLDMSIPQDDRNPWAVSGSIESLVRAPSPSAATWLKRSDNLIGGVVVALLVVMPLGAQISSLLKVADGSDWPTWMLLFTLVPLASILAFVQYATRVTSRANRT